MLAIFGGKPGKHRNGMQLTFLLPWNVLLAAVGAQQLAERIAHIHRPLGRNHRPVCTQDTCQTGRHCAYVGQFMTERLESCTHRPS